MKKTLCELVAAALTLAPSDAGTLCSRKRFNYATPSLIPDEQVALHILGTTLTPAMDSVPACPATSAPTSEIELRKNRITVRGHSPQYFSVSVYEKKVVDGIKPTFEVRYVLKGQEPRYFVLPADYEPSVKTVLHR